MELSAFLAKLIGIYFLVMAATWLVRKKPLEMASRDILGTSGLLAVTGIISLIGGVAIALSHSYWVRSWEGLVTLIGYLLILNGVMRIGFPAQFKKMSAGMMKSKWLVKLILIVVGIYLTYNGFMN